jgi:tRNA C32,U32 (ribose-2'-O)-methylase TrmJ
MKLNIVMVELEIPQNTGNIARTCAIIGAKLHLVYPHYRIWNFKTKQFWWIAGSKRVFWKIKKGKREFLNSLFIDVQQLEPFQK